MTASHQKVILRQEVKTRLQQVTARERRAASALLCQRLQGIPIWTRAQCVLFYAARWDELDLWPLLRQAVALGKIVALPQYLRAQDAYQACRIAAPEQDVIIGHYKIREPRPGCEIIPLNRLDFILVPGLGFSGEGYRLGRGKGYYDRLLARASGVKCGVGFDWQLGLPIPAEGHDIRLDCIITPSLWREFERAGTVGE